MKLIPVLSGLLLVCILTGFAGCSGTQSAPKPTPVPVPQVTSVPAETMTSAGPDLSPSPTDSIIEANRVSINVEKDYLGNVIVTFQGGAGLQQVNRIDVVLNRADGQVKTSDVGILAGDTATLEGTKNTDRVMVSVTMKDGKRYKLIDEMVPYRSIN